MRARTGARTTATIAALVLVGGGALLTASPANAFEPGDAAAIGGAAATDIAVGPFELVTEGIVGALALTEPGSDSATLVDQTLITSGQDPDFAEVVLGTVDTRVDSDEIGSVASSIVGDSTFYLFGVNMVSVEVASAAASCPLYGTPELLAETDGLTVLGDAVTLTDEEPQAVRVAQLPSDVPTPDPGDGDATVDLSTIEATVLVTQVKLVEDVAISVSLIAEVLIDGTYGTQVFDNAPIASMVLSEAACQKPAAPLSIASITPATGSTAGGETVTITGSGFVEGTAVTVGAANATGIVVDPLGDVLTAIVPAGTAGAASVTVTNPDGATATLEAAYTYAALAVPTPAAEVPARPVLAETGLTAAPLAAGAAGAVLLGVLLAQRRRRLLA